MQVSKEEETKDLFHRSSLPLRSYVSVEELFGRSLFQLPPTQVCGLFQPLPHFRYGASFLAEAKRNLHKLPAAHHNLGAHEQPLAV